VAVVLGFNQRVLHKASQQSVHPTLGIRRHFQAFFYASAFSQSDGVPPPDPARVTQTVGRWLLNFSHSNTKYIQCLFKENNLRKHFLQSTCN